MCKKLRGSMTVEATVICSMIMIVVMRFIMLGFSVYDNTAVSVYSTIACNKDIARSYCYVNDKGELDIEKKIWDKIYPDYGVKPEGYADIFNAGLFVDSVDDYVLKREHGRTKATVHMGEETKTVEVVNMDNATLLRLSRALLFQSKSERNEEDENKDN